MLTALRLSFAMELSADDRLAPLASLNGLRGATHLWCALLRGAPLQPFPVGERGLTGLVDRMVEHRTTAFSTSTSLFRSFMKSMPAGRLVASVRVVGEPVNSNDFPEFQQQFPRRACFVNRLGLPKPATSPACGFQERILSQRATGRGPHTARHRGRAERR